MSKGLLRKLATSRVGLFGIGAGTMYLFDPDRGRSRRTQLVSHLEGVTRRKVRRTATGTRREAHYLEGRLKGVVARARGQGHYHPESEVDLREHLRQVIHSMPVPTTDVTVEVARGRATLRGQVETLDQQAQIRDAVAAVRGVEEVEDFLHLPGTVAPNKASVLRVTSELENTRPGGTATTG
jgi:hypothetical protein